MRSGILMISHMRMDLSSVFVSSKSSASKKNILLVASCAPSLIQVLALNVHMAAAVYTAILLSFLTVSVLMMICFCIQG